MKAVQQLLYLTLIFVAWKGLLLIITLAAPGIGYDTSTTLLPSSSKLVRWDAIYYVQTARRGQLFEQEWAFGRGLSTLIAAFSDGRLESVIRSGIVLAHISHYLCLLLVWQIASLIEGQRGDDLGRRKIPFTAACLHVLSPAGIFLSAPYSEGPFACLNMLGFWLYLCAQGDKSQTSLFLRCLTTILSGVAFGCATAIRSNGILSGLPSLLDAMLLGKEILRHINQPKTALPLLPRLSATIVGGTCIAIGLLFPQYLAYLEYCTSDPSVRPWCEQTLPLIFSFVQSHYWGVGFLRYWTFSNIPLFLLAAPCLGLLFVSGVDAFNPSPSKTAEQSGLIRRLALPQTVLGCLAVTNYHVQIITRLCSGYPWLYIWLAQKIHADWRYGELSVRFFIIYAIVQAGLFASFLPPA